MEIAMDSWDGAEQQARDDYAHIRYLDMTCPNCGRERVEQCANGKIICEKCSWEPSANEYNPVHAELNR
jgi:ribosomal protein L37AE/L43A